MDEFPTESLAKSKFQPPQVFFQSPVYPLYGLRTLDPLLIEWHEDVVVTKGMDGDQKYQIILINFYLTQFCRKTRQMCGFAIYSSKLKVTEMTENLYMKELIIYLLLVIVDIVEFTNSVFINNIILLIWSAKNIIRMKILAKIVYFSREIQWLKTGKMILAFLKVFL